MLLPFVLFVVGAVAQTTTTTSNAASTTVVVKPNDMRVLYSGQLLPTTQFLNFQAYAALSGGGWLEECDSVVRLANAGDTASLMFSGTSIELDYMMDAAGGNASVYLDNTPLQQFSTKDPKANVTQNTCHAASFVKTGLADGVHRVDFKATTSRVFLQSFSYVTNSPPPASQPLLPASDVRVLMNSTELVYNSAGKGTTDFQSYVSSFSPGSNGFWEPTMCGSYVDLWAYGDSVTLPFVGTSVTVNIMQLPVNGGANVYVDGAFFQAVDNFGPNDALAITCNISSITKSELQPGEHNITILNTGATSGWLVIQSIEYTPSDLPISATVSSKYSNAPLIGGIGGGVIGVLLLGAALLFNVRRKHRKPSGTMSIDEEPVFGGRHSSNTSRPVLDEEHGARVSTAGSSPVREAPTPTFGIVAPETKEVASPTSATMAQIRPAPPLTVSIPTTVPARPLPAVPRAQSSPGLATLDSKALRPPTRLTIEAPPRYPSSAPPRSPPISPHDPESPTTSSRALVQRLLDSGVPSTEITAFIRLMEAEAGPSASRMAHGALPPDYDSQEGVARRE